MIIDYNDYNVVKVDIGTVTDSTKTEIGTPADFAKLAKLVKRSGLAIVSFKISTTVYVASLNAVVDDGDVVLAGVIVSSGDPAFVTATLEADTSKAYATLAVTAMPAAKTTKSK